jgi:cell division septal protein FtsQ
MANGRGARRPYFRLLPTLLLTALILGLPTGVYAWGRNSPSFTIDKVVVTGAKIVPERRAQRILDKEFSGRNLFTVTNEDVTTSLSPLAYVASAVVDRDFPDTLRVHLRERKPAAYALAHGRWYVVASDGHVIVRLKDGGSAQKTAGTGGDASAAAQNATPAATASAAAPPTGESGGTARPDASSQGDLAALRLGPPNAPLRLPRLVASGGVSEGRKLDDSAAVLGVEVIMGLSGSLRSRLDVVQVGDPGVTLHFRKGMIVFWGDGQRTSAKTTALRSVLSRYEKKGVTCVYMDVSLPDRVLARPVLD